MKSQVGNLEDMVEQELLRIDKYWHSQLAELVSPDAHTVAFYMELKAKEAAPFRKALAELKKQKN